MDLARSSAWTASRACCTALRTALPNFIVLPDDPLSETCWLPATCFARPSTPQDVAETLKIVEQTGSKFAMRCGGHNPNPLFSSIDDSVSGYLLGGGVPAFPALYGLGADQVKNFEVVLANSTIINANTDSNAELWQGLKGGGPNFGIVTRFDIQTYPQIKAQYTVNMYDPSDYINLMHATAELQEAMESDPKLGAFVYVNPTYVAVGLFYAEWVDKRPKAFDTFFNLESLTAVVVPTTNGTMKDLVYQEVVQKYGKATNLSYSLQPVPTAAVEAGELRGGNIMGLEKVPQTWWAFVSQWESQTNDTLAQQAIDELYQGMQRVSREKKQWLDFIFMNEGKWTQDVLASYGQANVQKMKDVQLKYDSKRVFQTLQNDGYLLRRSMRKREQSRGSNQAISDSLDKSNKDRTLC
ncbi:FAD-binding domain-containing protein [Xylaria sp. FL0064]|nr:FAD-binding domain-containing protein [Xylaria sp. FL0064]